MLAFAHEVADVRISSLFEWLTSVVINPHIGVLWILGLGMAPTPKHSMLFPGYQYGLFLWAVGALAITWYRSSLAYIRELWPFIALYGWSVVVSFVLADMSALRTTAILVLLTFGVYAVFRLVPPSRVQRALMSLGLLVAVHAVLALAMYYWGNNQLLLPGGLRLEQAAGFARSPRIGGLYQHPNGLGVMLFFAFIALCSTYFTRTHRLGKVATFAIQGLLLFTLYLTGSRASFLALFVSLACLTGIWLLPRLSARLSVHRTLTLLLLGATAIGLTLWVWFRWDEAMLFVSSYLFRGRRGLSGREDVWELGLRTVRDHPIFGVGLGNDTDYLGLDVNAHNALLGMSIELGFLGGLWTAVCLLYYACLGLKTAKSQDHPTFGWLAALCSAGVIGFAAHQMFEFQFARVSSPYLLFVMFSAYITTLRSTGENREKTAEDVLAKPTGPKP